MKILHSLFFCFLSDAAGFVKAQHSIWLVPEGGNLSIFNYFTVSGSTKFFCRKKCETAEDVLIKTDETTAQSGRYSIQYTNQPSGRGRLSFKLTRMIKSDSGMYRFGLGNSSVPWSYTDCEVRVLNELNMNSFRGFARARTVGEDISFPCSNAVERGTRKFLCKNQCKEEGEILIDTTNDKAQNGRYSIEYTAGNAFELYLTITNVTKSDTGQYRCGYGNPVSPDSHDTEDIFVVEALIPSTSTAQTATQSSGSTSTPLPDLPEISTQFPGYSVPLTVCVSSVGILLLVVVLVLFQKKRRTFWFNVVGDADNQNIKLSITN